MRDSDPIPQVRVHTDASELMTPPAEYRPASPHSTHWSAEVQKYSSSLQATHELAASELAGETVPFGQLKQVPDDR